MIVLPVLDFLVTAEETLLVIAGSGIRTLFDSTGTEENEVPKDTSCDLTGGRTYVQSE
jgi:hypothetical protein